MSLMIVASYPIKDRTEKLLEDEFIRRAENYLKKKRAKKIVHIHSLASKPQRTFQEFLALFRLILHRGGTSLQYPYLSEEH